MWLRCLVLSALVLALVLCDDNPPGQASIKATEEHVSEKETDTKEFEATNAPIGERRKLVEPTPAVVYKEVDKDKHPIKDGMITGAVLVPLGFGQFSGGHSINQYKSTFSIQVFKKEVMQITKKIEELRSSLKLLLAKYQSQRSASMKVLIAKYKSGIVSLRQEKLRIEALIRCTLNPGGQGCGGSGYVAPSKIVSADAEISTSLVQKIINAYLQAQGQHPPLPYLTYNPSYPQHGNYDWAKIASQLALLNGKYQNVGMGYDYGSVNYPNTMPTVNVFNGHSSYGKGVQDYKFSSEFTGQGYAPAYWPGYNPGAQGYTNLGMYGKDSFNVMSGLSDLTSSQILESYVDGSSMLESSLFDTEDSSELDQYVGFGDFEQQQFGSGSTGYGHLIGYLIPSHELNGKIPGVTFAEDKKFTIPTDVEIVDPETGHGISQYSAGEPPIDRTKKLQL